MRAISHISEYLENLESLEDLESPLPPLSKCHSTCILNTTNDRLHSATGAGGISCHSRIGSISDEKY